MKSQMKVPKSLNFLDIYKLIHNSNENKKNSENNIEKEVSGRTHPL